LSADPVAVRVEGLSKRFGSLTAVDAVSFQVDSGELFGFLGPNGAGKTTLVRMLTTLVRPSGGRACVAGFDVMQEATQVRRHIGVIPQAMTSDLDLTGYENMDIYARFYGVSARERKARIETLLETVGLSGRARELVATYSGGMRRRLEIARVLVHRPAVLFLDEPTIGLDPQSRRIVWDLLRQIRRDDEMTLFLTTHYMEEAEALCGRVAIIDAGRIVTLDSPERLKRQLPGNDLISLTLAAPPEEDLLAALQALPFVYRLHAEDEVLGVYVEAGPMNLAGLMEATRAAGGRVLSAAIHEQSLEDVFIHYTGKSIREEEAKKVSLLLGAGMPRRWNR
jgi:ABC-2 type transport system ATP-binding protein